MLSKTRFAVISADRFTNVGGKASSLAIVRSAFAVLVSIMLCALGETSAYAQIPQGSSRYFRVVDIGKVGQPRLRPTEIADVRAVKRKVPTARWPRLYYTFAGYEGYPADEFIIIESPTGPPKSKYSGNYSNYFVLNRPCQVEFNPVTHTLFTALSC